MNAVNVQKELDLHLIGIVSWQKNPSNSKFQSEETNKIGIFGGLEKYFLSSRTTLFTSWISKSA